MRSGSRGGQPARDPRSARAGRASGAGVPGLCQGGQIVGGRRARTSPGTCAGALPMTDLKAMISMAELPPPPSDVASGPNAPVALCMCGHPLERHDAVASRYCEVTISASLERGCVCR